MPSFREEDLEVEFTDEQFAGELWVILKQDIDKYVFFNNGNF